MTGDSLTPQEQRRQLAEAALDKADTPGGPTRHASRTVLHEALNAVNGDRNRDYGSPDENHSRTAELWNAYLNARLTRGVNEAGRFELDAADVCMLNVLQKVSRGAHAITRDTLVDIAGYAENAERCLDSGGA